MDSIFEHNVQVHGHARIMKVAGKQHEHYLDQFIVKKVGRPKNKKKYSEISIQKFRQKSKNF